MLRTKTFLLVPAFALAFAACTSSDVTLNRDAAQSASPTSTVPTGTVPPVTRPTVSLVANPTSVTSGGSATLTWSSTNATSCTSSGAWGAGNKATSGNQSTGALTSTNTFSLSCTGSGGSASASATVTVSGGGVPDTSPPTAPANLVAAPGSNAINLSWGASSDNVGVAGYTVSRNGVTVATRAATGYLDTGLIANTLYTYTVSAFDAANNISVATSVTATTLAPGTGTALGQLAALMQPGQWANFTTGNFDLNLVSSGPDINNGTPRSLFEYASRGLWDPIHKKIQLWGAGHYAWPGAALLTYDDATNTWSKEIATIDQAHGYQHLAMNPANGDLFHRVYNTGQILMKPYGQAWQSVASFNNVNAQITGALEWVPQLNNGAGGLALADVGGVRISNNAVSSWGSQINASSGSYSQNGVAINGAYYFGGGAGSAAFWRLNANGTITDVADPPVAEFGIACQDCPRLIAHPNGMDALLVGPGAPGNVYLYNSVQNTWTNLGAHQLGAVFWWVGITVPEYGVTVWLCQTSSVSTPYIRVFKP